MDETPRSIYTPGYFKTEKGVMGGLTAMYAHLRYLQQMDTIMKAVRPVRMKEHGAKM